MFTFISTRDQAKTEILHILVFTGGIQRHWETNKRDCKDFSLAGVETVCPDPTGGTWCKHELVQPIFHFPNNLKIIDSLH